MTAVPRFDGRRPVPAKLAGLMDPRALPNRARLALGRNVTLGTLMDQLAHVRDGRRLAEEHGGAALDYHQAARRVAGMAGGIAAKTQPGDRVVLALPNSYDLFLASLAACRAGAVAVPVNAELSETEIDLVASDCHAAAVIRDAAQIDGGDPVAAAPAAPGDVAAIFYTSGTTGRPKGARLTHRALVGQAGAGVLWPAALRRDEAVLGLPLSHIMGFVAVLALAACGVPVYFLPRFRPVDALDAIETRRATMFVGVPAMYRMMLEAGAEHRDLSCVRLWASGADAMPAGLARRFQQLGATANLPLVGPVGEAAFVEGYGMVEMAGGVALKVSPPGLSSLLPSDSVGLPIPPNRLKVVGDDGGEVPVGQVGELWVKGPGLLEGYHGDPEATAGARTDDGWLRTGDLVRRGPFGLFQFAGRGKDVIKRGGYSVYAVEVEGALEEHHAVAEAAVVGLPDDRLGEVPVAAVRLAPGESATGDDIVEWARGRLASFKVPARVLVVDDLPRTGTRKVRRAEVRHLFE